MISLVRDKSLSLSKEEYEELLILSDPVKWAYAYFGWTAFDYQVPILKNMPNDAQAVLRLGRRLGKCMPGYTKIVDPGTGRRVTIEEMYRTKEAHVVTMTEGHKLKGTSTNQVWDNGVKEVFRVELSSGKEVDATGNHPLYTKSGWVEIDDLKIGDYVATPRKLDCFGHYSSPEDSMMEIAYRLLSDHDFILPEYVFEINRFAIARFLQKIIVNGKYSSSVKDNVKGIQHLLLRFGIRSTFTLMFNGLYELVLNKDQSDTCEFVDNDIFWEKIVSIKSIGDMQTYDLTIPETHNFVAEDVIVHNTEMMCILILWYAFTQYNKKKVSNETEDQYDILIVAPFEKQIDLIFKRLKELIEVSPQYQNVLVINNKHQIKLRNGTNIIGITAGSKSGSGASNTRGQRADLIVFDEIDYMTDEDITNIRNIKNEDPTRIRIIAASTPSGKRESYYNWCTYATRSYMADTDYILKTGKIRYKVSTYKKLGHKPNGWTQYYAPSYVNKKLKEINPDTGQSYIDDLRDEFPEYRFQQEVLANFGEETTGVYQKKFIDQAISIARAADVGYANMQPRKRRGYRVLGVDWDKHGAESSLLAYEWDPVSRIFIPLDKQAIPKTEYTLTVAVETIIKMNAIHDFDWIFVDRGYGDMQVEQLHLYGKQHPQSNLHKKVIGVSFSEKIAVRDPYTKKKDDKEVKPFMVNNSVNLFEKGMVALDPKDIQLKEQLEQYSIKAISPLGRPTYSSENDHFIDALHLCLLGFTIKYDEMVRTQLARRFATVDIINDSLNAQSRAEALDDNDNSPRPVDVTSLEHHKKSGFGLKSFGKQKYGGRSRKTTFSGRATF